MSAWTYSHFQWYRVTRKLLAPWALHSATKTGEAIPCEANIWCLGTFRVWKVIPALIVWHIREYILKTTKVSRGREWLKCGVAYSRATQSPVPQTLLHVGLLRRRRHASEHLAAIILKGRLRIVAGPSWEGFATAHLTNAPEWWCLVKASISQSGGRCHTKSGCTCNKTFPSVGSNQKARKKHAQKMLSFFRRDIICGNNTKVYGFGDSHSLSKDAVNWAIRHAVYATICAV